MKYLLRKEVLCSSTFIELSADEYAALREARTTLTNAFAIEEKYEIVVSNFLDLEKEMLSAAADAMVRRTTDYSEFFEIRSALNIRMVNLLSSTRLYLDQLPQHINLCLPQNPAATDLFKSRCSKEYDAKFEYRFMEALRNHIQHRGIAVHYARQGYRWTSIEDDGQLEFNMDLAAKRKDLEEDEKFKKSILTEMPEEVDLKAAARIYVGSISTVNEYVREMVDEPAKAARLLIEAAHSRYSEMEPGKTTGLVAVQTENDKKISSVPLLLDWDDVRLELQSRNSEMTNLHRRYVTGAIKLKP